MPTGVVADSGCPEDADIQEKFSNKSIDEINLDAKTYSEEMPLIYMTPEAKLYYIQAYFRYSLDSQRIQNNKIRYATPNLHLIDTLAGKRERKSTCYSHDQLRCILTFLEFVLLFPDLFGESDEISRIQKAISAWTKKLRLSQ